MEKDPQELMDSFSMRCFIHPESGEMFDEAETEKMDRDLMIEVRFGEFHGEKFMGVELDLNKLRMMTISHPRVVHLIKTVVVDLLQRSLEVDEVESAMLIDQAGEISKIMALQLTDTSTAH